MIETLYSRPIRFEEQLFRLEPGDQVDNSLDLDRDWCTFARLGTHAEDTGIEDAPDDRYCDGNCSEVIFFAADEHAYAWHVRASDEIEVRFPMEQVTR